MPPNPETPKKSSEHRAARRIVGGIVGASIAGGAALGLAACDTDAAPMSASPTPTIEAPNPTASATPATTSTSETSPAPEIEGVSAELPPEELASDFMSIVSEWKFTGATDDTISQVNDRYMSENLSLDDLVAEVAEENAAPYVEALLPADWDETPGLVAFHDDMVEQNAGLIKNALGRFGRGEALVTEQLSFKFDGTYADPLGEQSAPDGERIIWFRMIRTFSDPAVAPMGAYYYLTFDTSSGNAVLKDYLVGNAFTPDSDS